MGLEIWPNSDITCAVVLFLIHIQAIQEPSFKCVILQLYYGYFGSLLWNGDSGMTDRNRMIEIGSSA
jgi:hypothetical protein